MPALPALRIAFICTPLWALVLYQHPEPSPSVNSPLLKYRVAAAAAVVGRLRVESAVVVVEDYVLALVARDVRDAREVAVVLGDEERGGLHRQHHARGVDVAALVVDAPRVLRRADCNVGRVRARRVARAVGAANEDRVVRVVRARVVAVSARDREQLRETRVDGVERLRVRTPHGDDARAARRVRLYREVVARVALRERQQARVYRGGRARRDYHAPPSRLTPPATPLRARVTREREQSATRYEC